MTIALYIYQGVTAGASGSVAAIISVYLQDRIRRMHNHLIQHQENFEVLKGAIIKTRSEIYPYLSGKERLLTHENYEVNYKSWEVYSILNYKDLIEKDEKTYEISAINKLLYDDIAIHWPEFYEKLDGWSRKIKETGIKSNEIIKVIFETIREKFKERNVKCDIVRGKNITVPGALTNDCVMATYNFAMDTDPDEWPNLHSTIENLGMTDILKEIAEEATRQVEKERNDFHEKIVPFLKTADELIGQLDELILKRHIKHSCRYI